VKKKTAEPEAKVQEVTGAESPVAEGTNAEGEQVGEGNLTADNSQDKSQEPTPDGTENQAPQETPSTVIETVNFKFNKNVKLDKVLIKAGETVEVTVAEAEEFTKAKHGEIVASEE